MAQMFWKMILTPPINVLQDLSPLNLSKELYEQNTDGGDHGKRSHSSGKYLWNVQTLQSSMGYYSPFTPFHKLLTFLLLSESNIDP